MCGIAGIVLKRPVGFNIGKKIVSMSDALSHRGPDGEGFMTATKDTITPHFNSQERNYLRKDLNYIPKSELPEINEDLILAFGHRRLSIIDLSECGHQPMCNKEGTNWIVYNGEIYNYLELKEELARLGHVFTSESDTEVILHAYEAWGFDCVKRFNGMWAFCVYDSSKQICFASRDRFGVKPFYYVNNTELFVFASEQKALVRSGLVSPRINQKALHNYLVNGLLENETDNFFEGITELWPGNNLIYDLRSRETKIFPYFHLSPDTRNEQLSEHELIEKIGLTLENAVRLRLRSDVEVGTCLSGGIDSSALAVIISEMTQKPLSCFTSVFRNRPFNEERFADIVAGRINARHYKTEPTLEGFESEVDTLIYSQDIPIWSTSTYAQYKVMELAKQHQIKVVLDGQGADELFAGYHHHFAAKWNRMTLQGNYLEALKDIRASNKTIPGSFRFYVKERLKQKYYLNKKHFPLFLNTAFLNSAEIKNPVAYFSDVNEQLIHDIYTTRLKAFLKCEDRCGMWHSVESRTPFSDDIELIRLMFSFNGDKKIKNGVSKYLLRESVKNKLPTEIYARYDKKGFQTPMQEWLQKLRPKLLSEIKSAGFEFVNYKTLEKADLRHTFQYELLFKLFVLSRWQKVFRA